MSKRIYLISLVVSSILISCDQETKIGENVIIDSNIHNEVNKHISPLGDNFDILGIIYNNHILLDSYLEDSLVSSTSTNDSIPSAPFKAFYILKGDSLIIAGEYGLASGFRFGFVSKLIKDSLEVDHFFCDEIPTFKSTLNDSLQYCIDVSCPNKKLVLSRLPTKESSAPIYGYIEFLTDDFYEKEANDIKKTKTRMKIYFYAQSSNEKE